MQEGSAHTATINQLKLIKVISVSSVNDEKENMVPYSRYRLFTDSTKHLLIKFQRQLEQRDEQCGA